MHMLNGTYIQASCRLYSNKKLRIFVYFTGNDGFLLISSGHGSGLCNSALTGTDVILFNQAVGIFANFLSFKESQFVGKLWLKITYRIIFDRMKEDEQKQQEEPQA